MFVFDFHINPNYHSVAAPSVTTIAYPYHLLINYFYNSFKTEVNVKAKNIVFVRFKI